MADKIIVGHRSTYKRFLRVLSRGKNKEGAQLDLEKFDGESVKSLSQLFEEIKKKEARLLYNKITGRIERHARSARIRIFELSRKKLWLEVARSYPNGRIVRQKKEFTMSETLKINEHARKGAVRCFKEEMTPTWVKIGYTPKESDLIPMLGFDERHTDIHESSVYEGILSVVDVFLFDLYLDLANPDMSLGEKIIINKDSNGANPTGTNWVTIYIRRDPDPDHEQAA